MQTRQYINKPPLNIHYIMPQGIGDVIMTIPVLKEIAQYYSVHFSITVKSKTEAEVIGELCPEMSIDYIYLQDIVDKVGFIISFFVLIIKIRTFSPDVILTQFNVSAQKSNLISFFAGVKKRVGWKGPFSFLNTLTLVPSNNHKIAENMKSLTVLDLYPRNVSIAYPRYNANIKSPNSKLLEEILQANALKIIIAPGSQELDKHKRWPKYNYISLIDQIISNYKNIKILLVGSAGERKLCEEIMRATKDNNGVINIAGKTTIKELIFLLSQANLTITNCNGISHLACASNSPIIVFYGPTNYKITGPISDSFFPISAGLECSPCFSRDYQTGCGNPVCMDKIQVKDVYKKISEILSISETKNL